jgi:hypothetical protein
LYACFASAEVAGVHYHCSTIYLLLKHLRWLEYGQRE